MGLKPMKRLLYTWFDNCSALFGWNKLIGHMYTVCGWDWSMAFYELITSDVTIIPAFYWCIGYFKLNCTTIKNTLCNFTRVEVAENSNCLCWSTDIVELGTTGLVFLNCTSSATTNSSIDQR